MTSSPGRVALETRGPARWIRFDRPAAANAIDDAMLGELEAAVTAALSDPLVRALAFTGCGRAFMAGADVAQVLARTPEENLRYNRRLNALFDLVESAPKPSVAVINGVAAGGGLELALACTLRVAADGARLGLPEVRVGLLPGAGGTVRLARLVGRGRALEMILTGALVDAGTAERIGLVNRVVPAAELEAAASALIASICANAPIAVALAKDAVDRGAETTTREAVGHAEANLRRLLETEDLREGIRAFLEKRAPRFCGR